MVNLISAAHKCGTGPDANPAARRTKIFDPRRSAGEGRILGVIHSD